MNNFELRTLTRGLFEPRTQDVARDGMVGPQPSPLRAGSRSTLALWCLRKALRLGPFRGEGAAVPQLEGGAPRARGRVWRLGRVGTPALAQSGRRRALGRRGPGQGLSQLAPHLPRPAHRCWRRCGQQTSRGRPAGGPAPEGTWRPVPRGPSLVPRRSFSVSAGRSTRAGFSGTVLCTPSPP